MVTLNSNASIARYLDVTDPLGSTNIPGAMFDLRTGFQRPEATELSTENIQASSHMFSCPKSMLIDVEGQHATAVDSPSIAGPSTNRNQSVSNF